jgi:selenocysteine lyase/cysteine desulfurase
MAAIRSYEQVLSRELLRVLRTAGATVYGLSDAAQVEGRVPTVCFNLPGIVPAAVTDAAAAAGIGIRDGHMYAPRLMHRLGLAVAQGAVRVSLVHYNTLAEIERFAAVLDRLLRTP